MLLLGPVVLSLCLFFFSRHLYFVCAQHEHAATKHNHYKTDFHLLYKRRPYRDLILLKVSFAFRSNGPMLYLSKSTFHP